MIIDIDFDDSGSPAISKSKQISEKLEKKINTPSGKVTYTDTTKNLKTQKKNPPVNRVVQPLHNQHYESPDNDYLKKDSPRHQQARAPGTGGEGSIDGLVLGEPHHIVPGHEERINVTSWNSSTSYSISSLDQALAKYTHHRWNTADRSEAADWWDIITHKSFSQYDSTNKEHQAIAKFLKKELKDNQGHLSQEATKKLGAMVKDAGMEKFVLALDKEDRYNTSGQHHETTPAPLIIYADRSTYEKEIVDSPPYINNISPLIFDPRRRKQTYTITIKDNEKNPIDDIILGKIDLPPYVKDLKVKVEEKEMPSDSSGIATYDVTLFVSDTSGFKPGDTFKLPLKIKSGEGKSGQGDLTFQISDAIPEQPKPTTADDSSYTGFIPMSPSSDLDGLWLLGYKNDVEKGSRLGEPGYGGIFNLGFRHAFGDKVFMDMVGRYMQGWKQHDVDGKKVNSTTDAYDVLLDMTIGFDVGAFVAEIGGRVNKSFHLKEDDLFKDLQVENLDFGLLSELAYRVNDNLGFGIKVYESFSGNQKVTGNRRFPIPDVAYDHNQWEVYANAKWHKIEVTPFLKGGKMKDMNGQDLDPSEMIVGADLKWAITNKVLAGIGAEFGLLKNPLKDVHRDGYQIKIGAGYNLGGN